MIIEDFEALKHWLSKTLEPICDADPSALAKYVLALVKKDKTDRELKALCIDQLDVFLQKETQGFVDKLFDAINTKNYLPQPDSTSTAVVKLDTFEHQEREIKKDEVNKEEEKEKKAPRRLNQSPQPSITRHKETRENRKRSNSDRESSSIQNSFRSGLPEQKLDVDAAPTRLSSNKVQNAKNIRSRDDRKREDRFRKREYDRNVPRRDLYRDRYNRRRGRSRSYSRSRSRSWSKERQRDRERDRSRSRTRSRDKDSGKPKFDLDRSDPVDNSYASGSSVSHIGPAHFPVPTLSSTITVITPSHHGNSSAENWPEFHEDQVDHSNYGRPQIPKKRCRDYDEKGFCMRGDMCPFDHGSDPVVVEDVNLPGILPFPAQPPAVEGPPPPGLPPPPPLLTPPPVNLRPPVPPPGPLPPSLPPITENEVQVRLRTIREQVTESQMWDQNSLFPVKRRKQVYVNRCFLKKIMEPGKTSDIEKNGMLERCYQLPRTEKLQVNKGTSDSSQLQFNMLNKMQGYQDAFVQPQYSKELDEETGFCKTLIPYMRRVPLDRRLEMHIAVLNCISSFCQSPASSGQNPSVPFTIPSLLPTPLSVNASRSCISDIPPYSQSTQTCGLYPQISHETHRYIQF
ncbi:RNA-binding protein 26 [Xenopus tropicalis]|uniref:RNA-binding protein 26 n=1 Tax=Xenopus tropicalis TaxID=8364 RepID=Q6NVP4_XENTR|eukprot:NP_998868.1 RNA-binding protein 26 [Xenopus tropicalis]